MTLKKLSAFLTALLAAGSLYAQSTHIDEIWVDTRATFHQQTTEGKYSSQFQGDYLNLHVKGQLTDRLSFRIRQRFTKPVSADNPFNATDFLWLRWQFAPQWAVIGGKQPIWIGGYEIDSAPIDVYYYGEFSNNLHQVYDFGLTLAYSPAEGQDIHLQFAPSPIHGGVKGNYSYNLYWNGHITSFWKTIWSYNLVDDQYHRKMNYLVLGNKFLMGPLVVDVDLIDRVGMGQKNLLADWSVIGKAILTLGKWNLCTKVGYETNAEGNVDADGLSYDTLLPAGTRYLYAGAGVEFFPLGNENLRLHAVYFRDNFAHVNNVDLGLTWRFTAYKR